MFCTAGRPRLVILQPSHFCEKARWALHRYGIEVDVDVQAPGFHSLASKGKGSTPCLIFPDGDFKDDSTIILHWIDGQTKPHVPKLFPEDCAKEVAAECARLDSGLGPDSRSIIYAHALDSVAIRRSLTSGVPLWQAVLLDYFGAWYAIKGVMRDRMKISLENGEKAMERVREEFQRIGKLLEDGREFLLGNKFTAADLTFAALSLPVLGVAYGDAPPFANPDEKPRALKDVSLELRATAAGAFALRIWEQHRHTVLQF